MPLMPWSDAFSVGVRAIDEQHKRLVALVNELHDAMLRGKGKDAVRSVLMEVTAYTRYHFATEEELMERHGFPASPAHRSEHEALRRRAADLEEECARGSLSAAVEVSELLRDWLAHHIQGTDRALGAYLKAHGVS